jgi:DNA mismatch repair protein MutL
MNVQPAAGNPAMPPSPAPLFTAAFASGAATRTWAPAPAAAPVPGDSLRSTIAPAAWPAPVVTLFPRDPAGQAHSGDPAAQPAETAAQGLAAASSGSGAAPAADPVRNWRFLGLAHRHFALFETPGGLMLLDRRAVHERIWYERLQASFARGQVPSQRLLLPIPIELDSIASALLLDAGKFLGQHGFEIREFGRNFFRVEAVPDWMKPSDAEPCVRDLLALLREGQLHAREINLGREELARFAATRGVRLPETVGETELRSLLAELFASKSPLTSPGGRPTFVELSHGELARRFGRG